jgi:hypothetical protein
MLFSLPRIQYLPGPITIFIFNFLWGISGKKLLGISNTKFQKSFYGDFPVKISPLFSGTWAWVGLPAATAARLGMGRPHRAHLQRTLQALWPLRREGRRRRALAADHEAHH